MSFFTAQISRSWNVLSTFFVINAMQGPQRPRRASTQALAAMTTPERRNSFEAAQVFKATTRFVVVRTVDLDQALHISSPRPRRLAPRADSRVHTD